MSTKKNEFELQARRQPAKGIFTAIFAVFYNSCNKSKLLTASKLIAPNDMCAKEEGHSRSPVVV